MSLSKEFDAMLKKAQNLKTKPSNSSPIMNTTAKGSKVPSQTSAAQSVAGGSSKEKESGCKRWLKFFIIVGLTGFVFLMIYRYSCRRFVNLKQRLSRLFTRFTGGEMEKEKCDADTGECEVLIEDVTDQTPETETTDDVVIEMGQADQTSEELNEDNDPLFTKLQDASK